MGFYLLYGVIRASDVLSSHHGMWMSSGAINWYLRFIRGSLGLPSSVFVASTYTVEFQPNQQSFGVEVRNAFDSSVLIVPVNLQNLHWCLVVVVGLSTKEVPVSIHLRF